MNRSTELRLEARVVAAPAGQEEQLRDRRHRPARNRAVHHVRPNTARLRDRLTGERVASDVLQRQVDNRAAPESSELLELRYGELVVVENQIVADREQASPQGAPFAPALLHKGSTFNVIRSVWTSRW
jgi:hypothetical protein